MKRLVIALVLLSAFSAHAEERRRVLYVGNEKGICEKILPFVDVCRERDIPSGTPAMVALQKYASYTKDQKDFSVVVDEAHLSKRSYNPTGLLASVAAITVGGGFGQGAMIGNKNPFGKTEHGNSVPGFVILENGDRSEEACGDIPYPECRARMLEVIKKRWPKKSDK